MNKLELFFDTDTKRLAARNSPPVIQTCAILKKTFSELDDYDWLLLEVGKWRSRYIALLEQRNFYYRELQLAKKKIVFLEETILGLQKLLDHKNLEGAR